MNIIFLGPPGAGKGTQAGRLNRALGLPHIASGDIFRDIREQDTPLAQEVRRYMDAGEYVPDNLTIEIVLERLKRPDTQKGFILDGFPRTLAQAQALDEALSKRGSRVNRVLYITAPTEVLLERIQDRVVCPQCHAVYNMRTNPPKVDMICDVCGHVVERRTDEDPDVMRTRLTAFERQTEPVAEYFRQRNVLTQIDGAQPLSTVEDEVDRAVGLVKPA
jgi:adenylate kinase